MHESEIKRRLRIVNQGLHNQFQAGAVSPNVVERLYKQRYELEKELQTPSGVRTVHLVCGHDRKVNVATYEEADMERTGTVQCRAIKSTLGWSPHRWNTMGVLGWSRETN